MQENFIFLGNHIWNMEHNRRMVEKCRRSTGKEALPWATRPGRNVPYIQEAPAFRPGLLAVCCVRRGRNGSNLISYLITASSYNTIKAKP